MLNSILEGLLKDCFKKEKNLGYFDYIAEDGDPVKQHLHELEKLRFINRRTDWNLYFFEDGRFGEKATFEFLPRSDIYR